MVNQTTQHESLAWILTPLGAEQLNTLMDLQAASVHSDQIARRNLRHLLCAPTACCLGAFHNQQLCGAGILLFRSNSSIARLYFLAVHPETRGQGVGRQLMNALEQRARTCGFRFFRLEVRMDNVAALRLYHALGFKEAALIPGYYNDRAHAFVLEKCICPIQQ